jgi:hypothetical protein
MQAGTIFTGKAARCLTVKGYAMTQVATDGLPELPENTIWAWGLPSEGDFIWIGDEWLEIIAIAMSTPLFFYAKKQSMRPH